MTIYEHIKEMTKCNSYTLNYDNFVIQKDTYIDWSGSQKISYTVSKYPVIKDLSRSKIDIFKDNPAELYDLIASTIRDILDEEAKKIENEFRNGHWR